VAVNGYAFIADFLQVLSFKWQKVYKRHT